MLIHLLQDCQYWLRYLSQQCTLHGEYIDLSGNLDLVRRMRLTLIIRNPTQAPNYGCGCIQDPCQLDLRLQGLRPEYGNHACWCMFCKLHLPICFP